jgi:hypothetical protein
MQRIKKIVKWEACSDVHNLWRENYLYESDNLRKAYELILENSAFFFEELANAFIRAQQIQNMNSTEMFVE